MIKFKIIGKIEEVEIIAVGRSIRDLHAYDENTAKVAGVN